jgi:hypothetical protein
MKLEELELDLASIDDGAWIGDIPNLEGVSFMVKGTEYEPYQKALRKALSAQHQGRKRRQTGVDVDHFDKVTRPLIAEHLLLDWDGIEGADGQPLLFSKEAAMRFLTERKYRPFQAGVMFAVNLVDAGLAETREDIAGN